MDSCGFFSTIAAAHKRDKGNSGAARKTKKEKRG
jgi:hypothetical protein